MAPDAPTGPTTPLSPARAGRRAAGAVGAAAAAWAVAGHVVPLLLGGGRVLRASLLVLTNGPKEPWSWAGAAAAAAVIGYGMGYRGFQRSYAPFAVARSGWLAGEASPGQALLAPLVAAGLLHASRQRRVRTARLFAMMGLFTVLVRALPEPHRAAVRFGVAVGLFWGAGAILALAARAAAGQPPVAPLDLPGPGPR